MPSEAPMGATLSGPGLHTGEQTFLRILPTNPGDGLVLVRCDRSPPTTFRVSPQAANGDDRCTRIGNPADGVWTVEHLLAVLAVRGLWDASVELLGREVPILDGSALPIWEALSELRPASADGPTPFAPAEQIRFSVGKSTYVVSPAPSLRVTVTFVDDHPAIGEQRTSYHIDPDTFERELAAARTFGRATEASALRRAGLARGASTTNCIVLGEREPIGTTVRWRDEFVRHKLVDLVGDLALLGRPLSAHVDAVQPGHRGNVALARLLEGHYHESKDAA